MIVLALLPLHDQQPANPQAEYDAAHKLLRRGYPALSQAKATQGYNRYLHSQPDWAAQFQILEAESLEWRGMYSDAAHVLAAPLPGHPLPETEIRKLTVNAVALIHLHDPAAPKMISDAEKLCANGSSAGCGEVLRARGLLAVEQRDFAAARELFLQSLSAARTNSDFELQATALANLAVTMLHQERYDEELDWFKLANNAAKLSGDANIEQAILGNQGYAYMELGDIDTALALYKQAETQAAELGNIRAQIRWISSEGVAHFRLYDLESASRSLRKAEELAAKAGNTQEVIYSLQDLTYAALGQGKIDEAAAFVDKLVPLVAATGNRSDELGTMLAQGHIARAKKQDEQAKEDLRAVEADPATLVSMRIDAEHEQALLFEQEGDAKGAEAMYRTALKTFESERGEIRNEDSKLPFLSNAGPVYDDYIHFLVAQGRTNDALTEADRSRAILLAQGLDEDSGKAPAHTAQMPPSQIAHKAGATLLFYWLAPQESYLWAIGPLKTEFRTLPPQKQIEAAAERYRKAVVSPIDPLAAANEDGRSLYQMLVAPVAGSIPPGSKVVILADGALNLLNFETLLAPGSSPNPSPHEKPHTTTPSLHYWIEDATVVSAPSLAMLAAARPPASLGGKLLLLGDAVPPSREYPALASALLEMEQIARHFKPGDRTVIAREKATPAAYLNGNPRQYSYIHFVTHGTASRTDPLDSAIVLSRANDAEDSFKLHAREIIRRPIDAQLVTISACYGGGSRAFAGEGLVGLSWGFMRAGAHNVIGALWEASDDSSPQLMNDLYQGLAEGRSPGDALHAAKLALVHSPGSFSRPYYWASFQLYTGR